MIRKHLSVASTFTGFDVALFLELLIFVVFVKTESFFQAKEAVILFPLLVSKAAVMLLRRMSFHHIRQMCQLKFFPPNWNFSVPKCLLSGMRRTITQPWIHDNSVSNLALANLSLTTVELRPQWERRPSQGSSSRASRALTSDA